MSSDLPFHYETSGLLNSIANDAFNYLDDHNKLSSHMNKSSWMMMGSRMFTEFDVDCGKKVGSKINMKGKMIGIPLLVNEEITERDLPIKKTWETRGPQRLVILEQYRMGFILKPVSTSVTQLTVFIDYSIPVFGFKHILAILFAKFYAKWCTESIYKDAEVHFRQI
jgi:hypothetical protein